jgi:hypothetical protein
MAMAVAPEEDCPSLAEAQPKFDRDNQGRLTEETVTSLADVREQAAVTVCWYRAPENGCGGFAPKRTSPSSSPPPTPLIACDGEGALYGEALPDGADECPTTIEPDWSVPVTELVYTDHYPATKWCTYETTYSTSCGGGPKLGPL